MKWHLRMLEGFLCVFIEQDGSDGNAIKAGHAAFADSANHALNDLARDWGTKYWSAKHLIYPRPASFKCAKKSMLALKTRSAAHRIFVIFLMIRMTSSVLAIDFWMQTK